MCRCDLAGAGPRLPAPKQQGTGASSECSPPTCNCGMAPRHCHGTAPQAAMRARSAISTEHPSPVAHPFFLDSRLGVHPQGIERLKILKGRSAAT